MMDVSDGLLLDARRLAEAGQVGLFAFDLGLGATLGTAASRRLG